jgi:hypothetical protein
MFAIRLASHDLYASSRVDWACLWDHSMLFDTYAEADAFLCSYVWEPSADVVFLSPIAPLLS